MTDVVRVAPPVPAAVWTATRRILRESFPAEELGPVDAIRDHVDSGRRMLWVDCSTQVQAVAVTCDIGTASHDVLLEFLAVDTLRRSEGRGSRLLSGLLNELHAPVILEVEDPEVTATPEALRRIAFYQRLGGTLLPCGRGYAMPNLASGVGVQPMRLVEMDPAPCRICSTRSRRCRSRRRRWLTSRRAAGNAASAR